MGRLEEATGRWGHRGGRPNERELLSIIVLQLDGMYDQLATIIDLLPKPAQASSVTFERQIMDLTVDSGTFTNPLVFKDDKGDTVPAAAGMTVTFASDNEAVATVVADASNPFQVDGTVVGPEGTANVTGTVLNADGTTFGTPTFVVNVAGGAPTSVAFENS